MRELVRALAGGGGHRVIVGTPEQVADDITHWFENGAADGFNLMPDVLPDGLEAFTEGVVPILQRRGIFRRAYEGTTLRGRRTRDTGGPGRACGGARSAGGLTSTKAVRRSRPSPHFPYVTIVTTLR